MIKSSDDTNGGKGWYIQRRLASYPIAWFLTYGQASDMQHKHDLRNDPVIVVAR
ncbi:MAG: hypothetical protein MN733_17610 [Nitrososphaera sp.]|nr:hypothetical protein [Nitrososphaera sp.]